MKDQLPRQGEPNQIEPSQVAIRRMIPADIPLGMRLKAQAGWNQSLADWQRFITLSPDGCFVASVVDNGKTTDIGTAATFTFGSVGWIAMILVDPAARGQGVGSAMMQHCIAHLASKNVTIIRLDATDLGKPVYDKLGFVDQFKLTRYQGTLQANASLEIYAGVEIFDVLQPDDLSAIFTLDQTCMHTGRQRLLEELVSETDHSDNGHALVAREAGKVTGYCMTRRGANASFIGPCVALTPEAGLSLLNTAADLHSGQRILIDVPAEHAAATAWAKRMALTSQRQLTRMCKGKTVLENADHLWASSGPEKG